MVGPQLELRGRLVEKHLEARDGLTARPFRLSKKPSFTWVVHNVHDGETRMKKSSRHTCSINLWSHADGRAVYQQVRSGERLV
jgi:hypothetical protein